MTPKLTILARVSFLAMMLLLSSIVFSQQKRVTGKVTDSDGQPVAGATVGVKGTNNVTLTASDGSFAINAKNGDVLQISFVGMKTQSVTVGNAATVTVGLASAATNLEEVVVTGYTAQKVKEITGSVSIVKPKDLVAVPAGQAEEMLQGRVAGLNVITSGQPGEGGQIYLGGVGNFGDTKPLYIIDGVQGDINSINPNDIESLQVLKDAGSAAIYGVRGGNGVIVITTKRGRGKVTVTYDGYYGNQKPLSDGFGLLNTRGRADLYDLAVQNTAGAAHNNAQYGPGPVSTIPYYIIAGDKYGLTNPSDPAADPSLYNVTYGPGKSIYQITKANQTGTDWFHEMFKPANQQSHTLTAAGGNDKSRYLFSLGYLDQKGTLIYTYLKRYTFRLNTEFNIKNNIRVGENVQVAYRENPREGLVGENLINETYREQPIIPVYDIMGGWGGSRAQGLGNARNPVALRTDTKYDKGYDLGVFGNVYAEIDIAKHFTARTSFGGIFDNYYYYNWTRHQYENAENNTDNGFSENAGYNHSYTWTNTLTYNQIFANDHSVKVLVGSEAIDNGGRQVGGSSISYFTDNPDYRFLSNGAGTPTNYSQPNTVSSLYSLFGRVDYAYKDKYLFTGTIRRDGSSVFGPENRYGTFPAFSVAWRITEEDFAKGLTWLTDLKLRGSWGKLGFAGNTDPYNQYTLFGGGFGDAFYAIDGSSNSAQQGFRATRIGNPKTGWEKDQKTDVGVDGILWGGKLIFSADWYKKKSAGLLFPLALPAILGGATAPNVNVGDMENHGFDLMVGSRGAISRDWKYDVSATLTTYTNKILSIPGIPYFDDGFVRNGNFVRNEVGHPVSAFYGYKVVGLFQDAADVSKSATQDGAAPGRFKYQDVNGDGKITPDDRVYYGNPNPKYTIGLSIGVSYKQFDLSTFMYGSFGNDIINYTKYWIDFYQGFEGNKSTRSLNESWTPSRKGNTVPIQEFTSTFSSDGVTNSYYKEDGSYFRNRTLILGYTLPKAWLQKAHIDRIRVYVQTTNLFTITKYSGLDPEIKNNSFSNSAMGIDYGNYPANQRQYIFGLQATF